MSESILSGGDTPGAQQAANTEQLKDAATESSSATTVVDDSGVNIQDWRSSLPDDLKSEASIATFKTPADVAKAYVNAVKKIGADKIVVPNQYTTDDEWQGIFQKLGLPESIDQYDVNMVEGDDDTNGVFAKVKEAAWKAGVLPRQTQAIYEAFVEASKGVQSQISNEYDTRVLEGINSLKQEWGMAYDSKIRAARAAVKHFGEDQKLSEYLDESGLGNDPKLIKLFAKLGETLKEDVVKGAEDSADGMFTPDRAKSEIQAIQKDPAYMDIKHPNHKEVVEKMQRFFKMAYGT